MKKGFSRVRRNRHSIYKMQGNLQPALIPEQRLEIIGGVYHKIVMKEHHWTEAFKYQKKRGLNNASSIKVCRGWHDFCVLSINPNTIFVDIPVDSSHGHSSIAGGRDVIMAGEIRFDDLGQIIEWNNKSGHYAVGSHHRFRTDTDLLNHIHMRIPRTSQGMSYLPRDKFRAWDGEI
ncbi:hypothetical protein [Veronia pacifica]